MPAQAAAARSAPLPAQPRDPMRGDIVEEAFRNSEARLRLHVPNPRLRHMLIGYVSKADDSQSLDLQRDALRDAGVDQANLYHDLASVEESVG